MGHSLTMKGPCQKIDNAKESSLFLVVLWVVFASAGGLRKLCDKRPPKGIHWQLGVSMTIRSCMNISIRIRDACTFPDPETGI